MLISDKNITELRGVGDARAKQLNSLGIYTIDDLLGYFPRAYEDRTCFCPISSCVRGQSVCIRAVAAHDIRTSLSGRGLTISKVRIFDNSAAITAVFFNRKYIKDSIKPGIQYNFFGKIDFFGSELVIVNPEFEPANGKNTVTGRVLPVYRLTSGISRNIIIKLVADILPHANGIIDILPPYIIEKNKLCASAQAYQAIHLPKSLDDAKAARTRLAYEEIFILCLKLAKIRSARETLAGLKMNCIDMSEFFNALDFELTDAQKSAVLQAYSDMTGGFPMNRLVQGDVGSGKTIVAAACVFLAARSGFQSFIMAPTEILATQHFHNLQPLFAKFGINCALLTGSVKKSERQKILARLSSGQISLLIGTHALLTDDVQPYNIGLVITDEQHRFGVSQRLALINKGFAPHVMLLSATPIPRTLALILFKELDVSIIDTLPPGRQKVDTFLIANDKRERMYGFIKKLVSQGAQGYIVCSSIEDNENENIKATLSHAQQLSENIFPELTIAALHGKMKPSEKKRIMDDFARGDIDILVSTTVIEVGVDVANAAFIVIENAERFGLSALHQLRGRVGRGKRKSYCILIDGSTDFSTSKRLAVMTKVHDGFTIAEEDLNQRGPGDFFGKRQHGLPELKVADFLNVKLLELADSDARQLLESDPLLALPEHRALAKIVFDNSKICG